MAERKKQHYVPKLYLRNFTSNGKYISIYNITKEEAIPHVPYDTQCYKDYYYGKDLLWETHLGTLETEWGAVFQKILSNESLTDNELNLVRQFAMYQLQRTAAINKYLVHQREEFLCEYGRLVCQKKGIPFDSDAEKHCKERAKSECSPAETLALADKYLPLIQDLSLLVIKYKTNQSLISSDVPVIAINQFHQPSIGYSCMGLIILFPITSNILVVLYDGKMYPKYKDYRYISINNESEVSNLNILQVISADKILFAKSEYSFSQISSKAMNARIVNRSLDKPTILGPDDNRLIINNPRTVIYDCNFSFGRVNPHFNCIPFVCKEAPPRQWDFGWQKKLEAKEQLLPTIISSNPSLRSQYVLTKKEMRRGCQRMTAAAKAYWAHEK